MGFIGSIASFFGDILFYIYENITFGNYGLAIIVFTIIIKSVLMPLSLKSTKSSLKMQKIQPEINQLKIKYKGDSQKQAQEMQKLFKDNKVDATGGCLPMLIQMPILISIFYIVRQPITYIIDGGKYIKGIFEKVGIQSGDETEVFKSINVEEIKTMVSEGLFSTDFGVALTNLYHSMDFYGLHLNLKPSLDPGLIFSSEFAHYFPALLIPVVSSYITYLTIKMTSKNKQNNNNNNNNKDPKADMAASMQSSMTVVMPVVTFIFAINFPVALGLYWMVSSLFQLVQQIVIKKLVLDKEIIDGNKNNDIKDMAI